MARKKKSRKIGKIGISKSEAPRKVKKQHFSKSTNTAGNKAGSRQQVETKNNNAQKSHTKSDVRLGSKKSISLEKYANPTTAQQAPLVKKLKPSQELDAIEQDEKLEQLLAKQEQKTLTTAEQSYVDKMLKRHKQLCDILGIELDIEQNQEDIDPLAQLDAIKLDDFKN